MDAINIKVLAEKLGLSTSTVSRAFRGNSDINAKTKQRILEMAETLGYQPNMYASSLRDQKSKTIAIVVPEFANNFFSQAIHGIEREARMNGYHTLIYVTDDDYEKEASFVTQICNGRVEGVIMSVSGEGHRHQYLELLAKRGIPLVFFDRYYDDVAATKVTANDYESSYAATKHLLDKGCSRVAYLVVNKHVSIGKIRLQGYVDALRDYGMAADDDLIVECTNDRYEIRRRLAESFGRLQPDGIFAAVERLAIATYRFCSEEGIAIPENLKVIGFSSLEIADLLNPALSTVTQPAYEMGATAAAVLFRALKAGEKRTGNESIILPSVLMERKSSAG
ncbi:LacI family DNA-binding transcriptional regulator [Parapedobacter sp. ISTM3]|uniref:Transcriptional regulator, LacI family n=1 Tax=Parapedobacter luteus TaxID=623280 RepID=A0A1T4ZV14_9SPHI|nr:MULTISPECIES: LacI family DNA-binding transcriptional regulator [Parapedobacter]MBK1438666.1 LacI family DNA-binding transcriptional regulator [Parapedobacter sp. ISTM3]SKB26591.1 transcriptional regulator, LacI family [Parapedobacter luteus]